MILEDKTKEQFGYNFNEAKFRQPILLVCDYCHAEFQKIKKYVIKQRKNICKDCCSDNLCTTKKINEVLMKNHGRNPISSVENLEKAKKAIKEKYGVENISELKWVLENREKTNLEKYGNKSYLQSDDGKRKTAETNLEKYNTINPSQNAKVKEKKKETCVNKFGVECSLSNEKVIEKRKQTNIKKYGFESYTSTQEFKEKTKKTCIEKYGVEHVMQHDATKEKTKKTNLERYGVESYFNHPDFKEKRKNTCMERYGVEHPSELVHTNKTQKEIMDWINSMGFNFTSTWEILEGKQIDMFDGNINIGIEYCGMFWHTECSPTPRLKNYHFDKFKNCQNKNIRLVTIFESEWKNREYQIKNFLKSILKKSENKIYARKCKISVVENKTANDFYNNNHIQGSGNLKFSIGLFYHDNMVGCMSLGKHHRKNINDAIVLNRFCFKDNFYVIGGSEKLFSECKKICNQQSYSRIISWSDNRWSNGDIYKKLNFKKTEDLQPDYSYFDIKNHKWLSKQSQKKSITGCPKEIKERDWCIEKGLHRIWDCGKIRWEYDLH